MSLKFEIGTDLFRGPLNKTTTNVTRKVSYAEIGPLTGSRIHKVDTGPQGEYPLNKCNRLLVHREQTGHRLNKDGSVCDRSFPNWSSLQSRPTQPGHFVSPLLRCFYALYCISQIMSV